MCIRDRDLDEKTLFRVTEGLGLGMGGMEGTCGAISAATVLAGLKCSTADLEHPNSKAVTYKDAKACVRAFKDRNGTVICRELKGLDSPDKKVVRTCPDCIKDAVEIDVYKRQGPTPFSEPESKALSQLADQYPFAITVSYHSQGEVIYWTTSSNGAEMASNTLAEAVSVMTGYRMDSSDGKGGFKDWMQSRSNAVPGVTLEVGRTPCPCLLYKSHGRSMV